MELLVVGELIHEVRADLGDDLVRRLVEHSIAQLLRWVILGCDNPTTAKRMIAYIGIGVHCSRHRWKSEFTAWRTVTQVSVRGGIRTARWAGACAAPTTQASQAFRAIPTPSAFRQNLLAGVATRCDPVGDRASLGRPVHALPRGRIASGRESLGMHHEREAITGMGMAPRLTRHRPVQSGAGPSQCFCNARLTEAMLTPAHLAIVG